MAFQKIKFAAFAACAGLLTAAGATPSTAAPLSSADRGAVTGQTLGTYQLAEPAQARRRNRAARQRWRNRRAYRRGYRAGRRSPPRGWRRYRSRPSNWRSRGCVIIGPVWFCP